MADVDRAASPDAGAPGQTSSPQANVGSGETEEFDWPDMGEEEPREERDDGQRDRQWWSQRPWHTPRATTSWSWRDDSNKWDWSPHKRTSGEAKGYLPKVPGFDGDRQKDPKSFQHYRRRVESFVAIAKAVIP